MPTKRFMPLEQIVNIFLILSQEVNKIGMKHFKLPYILIYCVFQLFSSLQFYVGFEASLIDTLKYSNNKFSWIFSNKNISDRCGFTNFSSLSMGLCNFGQYLTTKWDKNH